MTANTLKYKGYEGSVDFDFSDNLLSGKVLGIRAGLVAVHSWAFSGWHPSAMQTAFRQTIDDYLQYCKNENLVPEKPFSGNLNIRLGSERHQAIAAYARQHGIKINDAIRSAIDRFVSGQTGI